MYLYFYIDSKYEMCMRFLKCFTFFIILLSRTFSKSPTYQELRLTRIFAKSGTFSIPLEGLS